MPSYSGFGFDYTFVADIDLSASQYRFVVPASTVGNIKGSVTSGASVFGVLQNDPKAGEVATVRVLGTTLLYVDSASPASYGKFLKTGSNGQGLGYQSLTASTFGAAIALDNVTSGSGILVEAMIMPSFARG